MTSTDFLGINHIQSRTSTKWLTDSHAHPQAVLWSRLAAEFSTLWSKPGACSSSPDFRAGELRVAIWPPRPLLVTEHRHTPWQSPHLQVTNVCDTTPGEQFDKMKPICQAVMSRREPFPPLLIILAFVSTGGCRKSLPHQQQTSLATGCPKQGGHMPLRLCPFPLTWFRLTFGCPLGVHALISASTSNSSCWQGDARISRQFHSLQPLLRDGAQHLLQRSRRRTWWTPPLAGRTPRHAYTRHGKVLPSSLNPTADGSCAPR